MCKSMLTSLQAYYCFLMDLEFLNDSRPKPPQARGLTNIDCLEDYKTYIEYKGGHPVVVLVISRLR